MRVPASRITYAAGVLPVGHSFTIREKNVVFVCARSEAGVVIKTVMEALWI